MAPKISVLMPAYNCEQFIAEAIESIISQTFQDWELLIADDGSTDGTSEIIARYTDQRIKLFQSEKNFGVVLSRNKLLSHASADIITWLDADDTCYPDRLAKLYACLAANPDIALCGSNAIRRLRVSGREYTTNHPLTYDAIKAHMDQHRSIPFTGASVAFRRALLYQVTGFRSFFEIGGEDPDFIARVVERFPVANIPDALYIYRYTRDSKSRKFSVKQPLKLYVRELVFFLRDQRADNNGIDALMPGGDYAALETYISHLLEDFERDKSVLYRRACQRKLSNQDYVYACFDALQAIGDNPIALANYLLLVRLSASAIKAMAFRVCLLIQLTHVTLL